MVNSAGMDVDPVDTIPVGPHTTLVEHHTVAQMLRDILISRPTAYMVLALAAACAGWSFPLRRILAAVRPPSAATFERSASPSPFFSDRPLFAFLAFFCLATLVILSTAYWPIIGREINGSHRWVRLPIPGFGILSVQPSELAKWALPVVIAIYAARRATLMPRFFAGLIPGLAVIGIVSAAVAHEDLGTGVLIASAGCIILLAAGARFWHFALFIPPALAGIVLLILTSPYRVQRIMSFLNPYADPQGSGYHMIQSMAAVAGGEGFGRGLGHGLQKFGYLPEDRTDFLFAVLCEELGIAGAAAVIALYVGLLWAGLTIVRRRQEPVLKLAGLGIISTIGLQALINLAVVTGAGPTKGIALPLVSAGGTGWILTAFSLGLLMAMDSSSPKQAAEGWAGSPTPATSPGAAVHALE